MGGGGGSPAGADMEHDAGKLYCSSIIAGITI